MRTELKLAFRLLLLLPVFAACGNPVPQVPPQPVAPASMFLEQSGHFCGIDTEDKFTIGYVGSHPLGAQIQLYIVCHKKDTIFRDRFPAEQMLSSAQDAASDSVKIQGIHQAMHDLLDGRMAAKLDSSTLIAAQGQPIFAYAFPKGPSKALYFSKEENKVLNLLSSE